MSIARHHADWLSLVEVSGPFLSMPVLVDAFPQGLEAHDSAHMATLRMAAREWEENGASRRPDPAIFQAWIRFVLGQTLGFPDDIIVEGQALAPSLAVPIPEYGETLRPDMAIVAPSGRLDAGKPRLLVQIVSPTQDLEKAILNHRWSASPATRMVDLLHGTGVRLGLVTNGERWMLVNAPVRETSGFASWYTQLWLDEPVTLRAFRSLLSAYRFFGVSDQETVDVLLDRSASDQQEVTNQLGKQVREAVEILIQALDRADKDKGRVLLRDVAEKTLYQAALSVMMRLVFLFAAEERGMLRLGEAVYDESYAVSTLRAQLRATADRDGEDVMEHRQDAWGRLLATFRAVYGGVRHDKLNLPAYGGTLFDPDRFPFLEGRGERTSWRDTPAVSVAIHNRTVLHLLEALQVLRVRTPGGGPAEARLLSFRALDIEQIGHVYEGLLDHTAVRAHEPILGLMGSKDREPEIALTELERRHKRDGDTNLIIYLKEQTGRSEKALVRALEPQVVNEQRLMAACENNRALYDRVMPFAGLLRDDTMGYPVVIVEGSVYVTQGNDRRSTGTHYTPRSLTEPIVQYTLEPLVYDGPSDGQPRDMWRLRSAKNLLALNICDMTMGSGAFLVAACRYLADRLMEAWDDAERQHPGSFVVSPEGDLAEGTPVEVLLPRDPGERLIAARRLIAERCLYGVDINPMAVEMAKLSLWLVTVQKDRPFTFLDHALKAGDALLGVDVQSLGQWSLGSDKGRPIPFMAIPVQRALQQAIKLRREIATMPDRDAETVHHKERLLKRVERALEVLKVGGDLLVGIALGGGSEAKQEAESQHLLDEFVLALAAGEEQGIAESGGAPFAPHILSEDHEAINSLHREANVLLGRRHPFHWPLEFPEVFVAGSVWDDPVGFDALVGNPPFVGGQRITGSFGTDYRDYLVKHVAGGKRGSADYSAYFFLRTRNLLQVEGTFGLISTNTIAQGATREVGLDQLTTSGCTITRAMSGCPWPGQANLEMVHVWGRRGRWNGGFVLNDQAVDGITPFLTPPGIVQGNPYRLATNDGKSFQGSIVLGMGFVLTPEDARALIDKNRRNRDVLFPYLNGEDLNSRPDQSPSRWVIDFHDWPLERAETYPDLMAIVREKVKPEREKQNDKYGRDHWWQFLRTRPELYATIAGMERVLVLCIVTHHIGFAFVPAEQVFAHRLVVFPIDDQGRLTVLQSNLHECWARTYSSQLETRLNYSPSDCFDTFSFPLSSQTLDGIGDRYYTHRQSIMLARQQGLTKTYNRFHAPDEGDEDIAKLRDLQVVNSIGGFSIFLAGKAAGFRPSTQGGKSRLRA